MIQNNDAGELVDLRSDTVTRPSAEMRRAMARADVGDDVFGDDPTVNRLQHEVAGRLGKPAALYVPSGTMANQLALGALARPGEEVICEAEMHLLHREAGSVAANLGLMVRPLQGRHGVLDSETVRGALREGDVHRPRSAAVVVENTHNAAGGRVYPVADMRKLASIVAERGVPVHLDGSRLYNAAIAADVDVREWSEPATTVTMCFSKGLGAPIGSALAGPTEVIDLARQVRKRLGGAMRQAGVVAAAALVALESGVERLAEDHARAVTLARAIDDLAPGAVDVDQVETNMVVVNLLPFRVQAEALMSSMESRGVLVYGEGSRMRLVTHVDVTDAGLARAIAALRDVLGSSIENASGT